MARGPGDCLHNTIVRWTGQRPRADCRCRQYIRLMNEWGPEKCRNKVGVLVAALRKEARQRKWFRFAAGLPGARLFIRQLILNAIRESEIEETEESEHE